MIVCKLDRCTEPSMVFSDHPAAFNEWKNSKEPLRVLSKTGEPIATFMPFDEVFANTIVRNTFRRVNAAKKNEFPWLPFGIMAQHNLAVFHDSTNIFMIEKYRLTPQPVPKTPRSTRRQTTRRPLFSYKGYTSHMYRYRELWKLHVDVIDYPKGKTLSTANCVAPFTSEVDAEKYLERVFRAIVDAGLALGKQPNKYRDLRSIAKVLNAENFLPKVNFSKFI